MNKIVYIGITLIVILSLGCIDNVDVPNHSKENYIESTEKHVVNTVEIEKLEDMELNARPTFSIGQKFFYEFNPPNPISGEGYYYEKETFTVKGTERINGREYYVIVSNNTGWLKKGNKIEKLDDIINTWYYDKENGKCIGKNLNPTTYSDENTYATDASMFAYWMLGLRDDMKWDIYTKTIETETIGDKTGVMKYNTKYEFEVVGKEKVDDVLCFKVKMRYVDMDTKRVEETRYYWIDANRRILIKKEVFRDGIKSFEEKLTKEL